MVNVVLGFGELAFMAGLTKMERDKVVKSAVDRGICFGAVASEGKCHAMVNLWGNTIVKNFYDLVDRRVGRYGRTNLGRMAYTQRTDNFVRFDESTVEAASATSTLDVPVTLVPHVHGCFDSVCKEYRLSSNNNSLNAEDITSFECLGTYRDLLKALNGNYVHISKKEKLVKQNGIWKYVKEV